MRKVNKKVKDLFKPPVLVGTILFCLVFLNEICIKHSSILEITINSLVAGLAGLVSGSAYLLTQKVDESVDKAANISKKVEDLKNQLIESQNKAEKAHHQAQDLLDATMHLSKGLRDISENANESLKSTLSKSFGIIASSWASHFTKKGGDDINMINNWWTNLVETYVREEAYDIYLGGVSTNARNYLLFILSTIGTLIENVEKKSRGNGNLKVPKVSYFACSSVPPRHYFNFPFELVENRSEENKYIYYSHERIIAFTIGMQSIVNWGKRNNKNLEISRTILAPKNMIVINRKCLQMGWPIFHLDSEQEKLEEQLNGLFIANITVPNIEKASDTKLPHQNRIPTEICLGSIGVGSDSISYANLGKRTFIPICENKDILGNWLQEKVVINHFLSYYKNEIAKCLKNLEIEINSIINNDELTYHQKEEFDIVWKNVEIYVKTSIDMQNIIDPLNFFNCFHKLELFLAQFTYSEHQRFKCLENTLKLFNNVLYLWQYIWFKADENSVIKSLGEYWAEHLHTGNNAFICNPEPVIEKAKEIEGVKLWPNFTLFGIEDKIKFTICSKTDKNWDTAQLRMMDESSNTIDKYKVLESILKNKRIKD